MKNLLKSGAQKDFKYSKKVLLFLGSITSTEPTSKDHINLFSLIPDNSIICHTPKVHNSVLRYLLQQVQ